MLHLIAITDGTGRVLGAVADAEKQMFNEVVWRLLGNNGAQRLSASSNESQHSMYRHDQTQFTSSRFKHVLSVHRLARRVQ